MTPNWAPVLIMTRLASTGRQNEFTGSLEWAYESLRLTFLYPHINKVKTQHSAMKEIMVFILWPSILLHYMFLFISSLTFITCGFSC